MPASEIKPICNILRFLTSRERDKETCTTKYPQEYIIASRNKLHQSTAEQYMKSQTHSEMGEYTS